MTVWAFILVVLYGACVGSFLNVVIYRLPEGRSLVSPGSHCPRCGTKLAWYDNIPVLGWLWLRGRCRYCGVPISVQYPLVELLTALVFGGLFAAYYWSPLRPEFADAGLGATWLVLAVHLLLLAGLLAATAIDARLYIIPLQIPWAVTVAAVILLPLGAGLGWIDRGPSLDAGTPATTGGAFWLPLDDAAARSATGASGASGGGGGVVPEGGARVLLASLGGVAGLLLSLALLQASLLPRSFDELEKTVDDPSPKPPEVAPPPEGHETPDDWLAHPHPRREMVKELAFLSLPVLGMVVGWWIGGFFAEPGFAGRVLAGVLSGYLVGGGIIWATRVLGTLGFGKEAMGLGDVHLLAAIGAVLGPIDAVFIFFTAPFFGLAAAVVMMVAGSLLRQRFKAIPYGPYLSGAAAVVMVCRGWFYDMFEPLVEVMWKVLQA